jgi:hypothetical protein
MLHLYTPSCPPTHGLTACLSVSRCIPICPPTNLLPTSRPEPLPLTWLFCFSHTLLYSWRSDRWLCETSHRSTHTIKSRACPSLCADKPGIPHWSVCTVCLVAAKRLPKPELHQHMHQPSVVSPPVAHSLGFSLNDSTSPFCCWAQPLPHAPHAAMSKPHEHVSVCC